MTERIFSHRPLAGVSVGAYSNEGQLFVAFAMVNDGSSRNGIFWDDREDTFSRATARAIINGRITSLENDPSSSVPNALSFTTDLTARQFIAAFRLTFKPDPEEADAFLSDVVDFGELGEARVRPMASEIAARLETLANEVVANASVSL